MLKHMFNLLNSVLLTLAGHSGIQWGRNCLPCISRRQYSQLFADCTCSQAGICSADVTAGLADMSIMGFFATWWALDESDADYSTLEAKNMPFFTTWGQQTRHPTTDQSWTLNLHDFRSFPQNLCSNYWRNGVGMAQYTQETYKHAYEEFWCSGFYSDFENRWSGDLTKLQL